MNGNVFEQKKKQRTQSKCGRRNENRAWLRCFWAQIGCRKGADWLSQGCWPPSRHCADLQPTPPNSQSSKV